MARQRLQDRRWRRRRSRSGSSRRPGSARRRGRRSGCRRRPSAAACQVQQRPVDLAPPGDLRDVELVAPERARHPHVGLEEEAGPTDERRHVVGRDPEAEVAVPVDRRGRGDDQRIVGAWRRGSGRISEKFAGTRSIVPGREARPGDVRQEVRAVADAVAERAVQRRPVVERVHLVDPQRRRTGRRGPRWRRGRDRLAVGERHDDVATRAEVVEHGFRRGGLHSRDGTPPACPTVPPCGTIAASRHRLRPPVPRSSSASTGPPTRSARSPPRCASPARSRRP